MAQEFKETLDPATTQYLYDRKFVMKAFEEEAQSDAAIMKGEMSQGMDDDDRQLTNASTARGDGTRSQHASTSATKTPFALKSPAIEPAPQQYKYRDWRDIY